MRLESIRATKARTAERTLGGVDGIRNDRETKEHSPPFAAEPALSNSTFDIRFFGSFDRIASAFCIWSWAHSFFPSRYVPSVSCKGCLIAGDIVFRPGLGADLCDDSLPHDVTTLMPL